MFHVAKVIRLAKKGFSRLTDNFKKKLHGKCENIKKFDLNKPLGRVGCSIFVVANKN